jgi:hypothetical protein
VKIRALAEFDDLDRRAPISNHERGNAMGMIILIVLLLLLFGGGGGYYWSRNRR